MLYCYVILSPQARARIWHVYGMEPGTHHGNGWEPGTRILLVKLKCRYDMYVLHILKYTGSESTNKDRWNFSLAFLSFFLNGAFLVHMILKLWYDLR